MLSINISRGRFERQPAYVGGLLRFGIISLLVLVLATSIRADLYEAFETTEPSWELAEADCPVQLATHRRSFQQQRNGQGSEFLHLRAGTGTKVYLKHGMPAARIIDELAPSVWVKSDQSGIQLMLRVVLPHSPADDGEPIRTLLRGDAYTDVGNWQVLRINDLPRLLAREVAMLRTRFGPEVDAREAYADLVVLNAYGGAGDTQLWIDDLRVDGIARTEITSTSAPLERRPVQGEFVNSTLPLAGKPLVEFQGNRLSVEGRPIFIRAVEHRGERFDYLKGLGFNAVRLSRPATGEQLAAAEELGVWLIAPPPVALSNTDLSDHRHVVAWDTGDGVSARDLEAVRQLAANARAADPLMRPVLSIPRDSRWQYSLATDIVGMRPAPHALLAGELELADYRRWYEGVSNANRPGIATWAILPSQLPRSLIEQWRALRPDTEFADCVEPQQLHLLAYQALAAGARGMIFTSRDRLDSSAPSSGMRANLFQCLNQQLELLEPWIAGGDLSDEFEISDNSISVSLLKTERSTLAILSKTAPGAQYVTRPMTPRPVTLVVRGVSASSHAFAVTPIGLHTLKTNRQGALRIELDRFRHSAVVMITHDSLVMNHLSQAIGGQRQSAARARRELVARQLALTWSAIEDDDSSDSIAVKRQLEQAESFLSRAELLLDAGDPRNSVGAAAESLEFIASARHAAWHAASRGFASPTSSPACVSFASLPLHRELVARLDGASWGRNRLPGGNMEDLGLLQQSGWQQDRTSRQDIETLVELSPAGARSGEFSLRMVAASQEGATLDHSAIEIRSAGIPVRRGQLVQLRGWAKVIPKFQPANDSFTESPLLVYDSFAGPTLGQSIEADGTWREFVLYRAATDDGEISLTFSLKGFGEALIDEVTIIPLLSWGQPE